MPSGPDSQPAPATRRSPLLTLVGVLVLFEALILVAAAVYLLHGLLVEDAAAPIAAIAMVAMALIFAAAIGFCGRGLLQRSPWARSPVVVWQLLELAAGIPAFSGGSPWVGVVLVVPAVVVLVGLFLPSVSAQVSR